jgi:hypothetical protein
MVSCHAGVFHKSCYFVERLVEPSHLVRWALDFFQLKTPSRGTPKSVRCVSSCQIPRNLFESGRVPYQSGRSRNYPPTSHTANPPIFREKVPVRGTFPHYLVLLEEDNANTITGPLPAGTRSGLVW